MAETSLIKRLVLKPGYRLKIMNAPEGYLERLHPLPENTMMVDDESGPFDMVQLFAKDIAQLNREVPTAVELVKHDGLLWLCYPKRSSKVETDLPRDIGWQVIFDAGWHPVTQISIDEVWSGLRFRPNE